MNEALRWAALAAFALQQFDEASQEEQARTGKSAVELLDSALEQSGANEQLAATLREKFLAMGNTPETI